MGIPGLDSVVQAIIDAFIGIFLGESLDSLDVTLSMLLGMDRPDFGANWFLKLYGVLFALSLLIALVVSGIQGAILAAKNEYYGLRSASTLYIKQYLLAYYLPGLVALGYVISTQISYAISQTMPDSEGSSILDTFMIGDASSNIAGTIITWILAMMIGLETFVIKWLLPYIAVLFGVMLFSFGGRKGSSTAIALIVTSVLSLPAMVTTIVITAHIAVGMRNEGFQTAWVSVAGLTVTFIMPFVVMKWASPPITAALMRSAAIQASQQRASQLSRNEAQSAPRRGPSVIGLGVAAGAGAIVASRLGSNENDRTELESRDSRRARRAGVVAEGAVQMAKTNAARAGSKAATVALTGGSAVVATIASGVARRAAQRDQANRP